MFKSVIKNELRVPANIESIKQLRNFVNKIGHKHRFSDKVINSFQLAVDEASSNIIRHAYRDRAGDITIRAIIRKNSLTISLIDHGRYFDPGQVKDPDLQRYVAIGKRGGLGIFMIRKLVDEIDYRKTEEGNELRLTKNKDVTRKRLLSIPRVPGSMRVKYYSISAAIITVALLLGYFYNISKVDDEIITSSLNQIQSISQSFARNSTESLFDDAYLQLLEEARNIVYQNQNFVSYSVVTNLDNIIKGTNDPSVFPLIRKFSMGEPIKSLGNNIQLVTLSQLKTKENQFYVAKTNVYSPGSGEETVTGTAYVYVPEKIITDSISKKRLEYSKLFLLILVLSNAGVGILIFLIFTPFQKLYSWVRDMGQGDIRDQIEIDTSNEIGKIAHAFSEITDKFRESQKSLADQERIQQEMHLAKEIQQTLLPAEFPNIEGYEIASHYESAKEVGGDYYDFVEVDRDRIGIVVADVSGKGVPGSLVMTMIRTALRTEAKEMGSAAEVLARVNNFVLGDIKKGMFVTLFYTILDSRKRRITFSSAGHNPMILYRGSTKRTYYLNPKGFPVGIALSEADLFRDSIEDDTIQLTKDDIILCHTDGITEAMNSRRELFGEERLLQVLRDYGHLRAKQFVEKLKEELVSFTEGQIQNDDITLVVIKENMSAEEYEFERAKQVYYSILNGKSMTEACNEIGMPVSTFSQKYRSRLEEVGIEEFKKEFETTSVEAKHLSIEDQTKIYDVIRNYPEWGPKRISDQLNTEEYGFTIITENRIYEELVRKRLNTRALREAYVARGVNKKRMKPPGTPMLTLDGKIIMDDQLGPKLHAPSEPVRKLDEREREATEEQKAEQRKPAKPKKEKQTPIDKKEESELILSDIVELFDKKRASDEEIEEELSEIEELLEEDLKTELVEEEIQDAEYDTNIKEILDNDDTDKSKNQDEEIDFSDLSEDEYSEELFEDRTNGDEIDTEENIEEKQDQVQSPQEKTEKESGEKRKASTADTSPKQLFDKLSVEVEDYHSEHQEDSFDDIFSDEEELGIHHEASISDEEKFEKTPKDEQAEKVETEGEDTEKIGTDYNNGIESETGNAQDEADDPRKIAGLFEDLSVHVESEEDTVHDFTEHSDKKIDEFFDLVSEEEINLEEEMVDEKRKPSKPKDKKRKQKENQKEDRQQKLLIAGGHFYLQRRYDKAIDVFEKIVNQHPNNIEAYYNLGNSYFRLKKLNEAQKAYEKVCELDPTFLDAMENLGVIFANKKEFNKAIEIWEKILEFDPKRKDIKKNIEKANRIRKQM